MRMDNEKKPPLVWDLKHASTAAPPAALEVLFENAHLLPARGEALDLACGLGGSALFLAQRGLHTAAWDRSAVAIDALTRRAQGLPLSAAVRDVSLIPPEAQRFDVICVGHFLDRALCPAIAAALRPGGLLFYQTFTKEKVDDTGPRTAAYRLDLNELPMLFPDLIVRLHREEGAIGDPQKGFRNRAQFIGQRPPDR